MFIQLQPQYLTIWELELELFAIEHRIILVDNAMVIGTDDNDVRGVVVLRTGEVVDVVGLDNAVAILVANLLAADLVAIVVEPLQGQDDAAVNANRLLQYESIVVIHQSYISFFSCLLLTIFLPYREAIERISYVYLRPCYDIV